MSEFKLIVNDVKTGKSYTNQVNTDIFKNKKIGDKVSGDSIGLKGYEFQITGGSDKSGFPMRKDVEGIARRKCLFSHSSVGVTVKRKGNKIRKSVRGNTISLNISQINLKVVKQGAKKLEELLGKKEGEAKEEKPKEKPKKEETKEEKNIKEEKESKTEDKDGKV